MLETYLDSWRVEYLWRELTEMVQAGLVVILTHYRAHLSRTTGEWEVAQEVDQVCDYLCMCVCVCVIGIGMGVASQLTMVSAS